MLHARHKQPRAENATAYRRCHKELHPQHDAEGAVNIDRRLEPPSIPKGSVVTCKHVDVTETRGHLELQEEVTH